MSLDGLLETATDAERSLVTDYWFKGWTPPPNISVSEWADEHRQIPRGAGAEPGKWRTSRTPYLREILDCLSDYSPVCYIDVMKSTQVGATEIIINGVFYVIHHCPTSVMVVQPTGPLAKLWSIQRFRKAAQIMPCIADVLPQERGGDGTNTTTVKDFPGGMLLIGGAGSSANLRMAPIRYMFLDELDEYETDLNKQGGADEQVEERTASFADRKKVYRASTPTVDGASKIQAGYYKGDQRDYHVPCPHCGFMQPWHIDNLLDDGRFVCVARLPMSDPKSAQAGPQPGGCGAIYGDEHKQWMLERGVWIAKFPDNPRRSYHIWKAMTPQGLGDTWLAIAKKRAEAEKDPEKRVTFYNMWLGLAYAGLSDKIDTEDLAKRAEGWARRTIPRGCLLLTASVDVQHNRFSVLIVGYGRGEQMWFIDWVELPGDPTREEDWEALHLFLEQPIHNSCGIAMRPECRAVDSGKWTHEVYRFVRKYQALGYIAVKGDNTGSKPVISRASKVDINYRGSVMKAGLQLWIVGGDTSKTTLFARINGDTGAEADQRRMHFPADMPPEFYKQWGGERFDTEAKRWVPQPGVRNEVIDNTVYAFAAAVREPLRVHLKRDSDWAALEAKLEPATADLFGQQPRDPEAAPPPAAAPVRQSKTAAAVAEALAAAPVPEVLHETPATTTRKTDESDYDDEIQTTRRGRTTGWGR